MGPIRAPARINPRSNEGLTSRLSIETLATKFAAASRRISAAATAQVGTPSNAALPSANVGQAVTLSIPAAAFAITQQGFATGQAAVFQTIDRSTTTGQCARSTISVQGTVAPGQTSLSVDVPACADSDQVVRVPGHGTARLLVVPVISSLDLDPTIAPTMLIKGSGFVCGATESLSAAFPSRRARWCRLPAGSSSSALDRLPGARSRSRLLAVQATACLCDQTRLVRPCKSAGSRVPIALPKELGIEPGPLGHRAYLRLAAPLQAASRPLRPPPLLTLIRVLRAIGPEMRIGRLIRVGSVASSCTTIETSNVPVSKPLVTTVQTA